MSKRWNGVPPVFRFFITLLRVLVHLTMNDDGVDDTRAAPRRTCFVARRPIGRRDDCRRHHVRL